MQCGHGPLSMRPLTTLWQALSCNIHHLIEVHFRPVRCLKKSCLIEEETTASSHHAGPATESRVESVIRLRESGPKPELWTGTWPCLPIPTGETGDNPELRKPRRNPRPARLPGFCLQLYSRLCSNRFRKSCLSAHLSLQNSK